MLQWGWLLKANLLSIQILSKFHWKKFINFLIIDCFFQFSFIIPFEMKENFYLKQIECNYHIFKPNCYTYKVKLSFIKPLFFFFTSCFSKSAFDGTHWGQQGGRGNQFTLSFES